MNAVTLTRAWTNRPFGFLLLPADGGGQAVTLRAWSWTARIEFDCWRRR